MPGCSTGEEAYSLAILLAEEQEKLKKTSKVQIFATDIDSRAIAHARAGIYPASIAADISADRLARYFSADPAGDSYLIQKAIRDLLVFSEQDLIRDPPFSKLDLISCRNLLIYMGGELQKRIVPLFHYALNPGGYLFLGTSESVGEFSDLFATLERKQRLYQRKDDFYSARHAVHLLPPTTAAEISLKGTAPKLAPPAKQSLRELTEQAILHQLTPVVALVGSMGEILYLHGRSGCYLEPPPGEPGSANILKMAREGLKRELTTALHKAVRSNRPVHFRGLKVKTNGAYTTVDLSVRPQTRGSATTAETQLYLVVLEEAQYPVPAKDGNRTRSGKEALSSSAEMQIRELEQELRTKDEYLQTTNEELETSNEELKSSNEEMQSVNEELQSTNEELETSKEELQSVNEELATVNAELQSKVADLTRANNDMNNLLAGTGIATIFVDHSLRILRYNPEATKIINLILNDVGRPIIHIVSKLVGFDCLEKDIRVVLDSLVPAEREVKTAEGHCYQMRILPYRTLENVIEGAVLTFVDITAIRETQAKLTASEALLNLTQQLANCGGWVWDLESRTMFWTAETYRIHGFDPDEFASGSDEHITRALACYRPEDRPVIETAFRECAEIGQPYELELNFSPAGGPPVRIRSLAEPVMENGKVVRVAGIIMKINGPGHNYGKSEIKSEE